MSTISNNVYIGKKQVPLLPYLRDNISRAKKIKFIVSFIKDSGIRYIINDLKTALNNGAELQILTSDYMGITEPNALYRLLSELKNKVSIKLYSNPNISFHPKTYIFEYENNQGEIIIGSSNLSKSALIDGIEWNYKFEKTTHNDDFESFLDEFNELYEKNSFDLTFEWIREYQKNYKKSLFFLDNQNKTDESTEKNVDEGMDLVAEKSNSYNNKIEPINFQIPALYELSRTREEGFDKAMVIAATGLGKTYLTAFDTLNFNKILFVAHREEILTQAEKTYKKVHLNKKTGFFMNNKKEISSDIIFATIQTLGKDEYLKDDYFTCDYFDYIIIDEFHHSTAESYTKLINYFKPKFLLGVTATPDRMDNSDVYKICDYNIAYECNLKTAINNGWLVPFQYYGIYDEDIDYSKISLRNGKYVMEELEEFLNLEKRAEKILEKYKDFSLERVIGFCAGIKHCDFMNNFFKKHKIKSESIHSKTENRKEIIERFEKGEIKILFVVDIFNEGIDIPAIDGVLFLRPTESHTIFIQQLGRGLRIYENKEYLTVIDFVGNYKGANLKPLYLTGNITPKDLKSALNIKNINLELPQGCNMNFDLRLIDLFKEMSKNRKTIKDQLIDEYLKIKNELGFSPKIMDIFEESNYPVNIYIQIFGSWLTFKNEIEEAEKYEKIWSQNIVGRFLGELEKTAMTKSYKIPVFLAFLEGNSLKSEVKMTEVVRSFRNFYLDNKIHLKDIQDKSNTDWQSWDDAKLEKFIIKNPVGFLSTGKSKEFFEFNETEKIFRLSSDLVPFIQDENRNIATAFEDRVKYRLNNYFRRKFLEE